MPFDGAVTERKAAAAIKDYVAANHKIARALGFIQTALQCARELTKRAKKAVRARLDETSLAGGGSDEGFEEPLPRVVAGCFLKTPVQIVSEAPKVSG